MKSKSVCLVVACVFSMVPWLQAHTPGADERERLQEDKSTLYNLEARRYNPQAGRFTSIDPKREFVNPYSYTGNNPVLYVDPDGKMVFTATSNADKSMKFISVKFETWYPQHMKSTSDSIAAFVPLSGAAGAAASVVQEASRFLKGTAYLPYANIGWIEGSGAITGFIDQSKFESRVLEHFEALMPGKINYDNEFHFVDSDGRKEITKGLQNVATAILATLVEMEVNGELSEGNALTIFEEFGFEDVINEAREDDNFLNDVKNLFIDKATDAATDAVWDKAQEILKK